MASDRNHNAFLFVRWLPRQNRVNQSNWLPCSTFQATGCKCKYVTQRPTHKTKAMCLFEHQQSVPCFFCHSGHFQLQHMFCVGRFSRSCALWILVQRDTKRTPAISPHRVLYLGLGLCVFRFRPPKILWLSFWFHLNPKKGVHTKQSHSTKPLKNGKPSKKASPTGQVPNILRVSFSFERQVPPTRCSRPIDLPHPSVSLSDSRLTRRPSIGC